MRRRRLLLLAVAMIVLACACARACGGGTEPTPPPPSPPPAAGPPPAGPPAPPLAPPAGSGSPAESPAGSPVPGGRAGQESPADDAEGVVTGAETLDAARAPEAVRAAERFARAWAAPDAQWPEPLLDLATPALADALARSAGPPEREVTGAGLLLFDAPRWARVGVPTADGTVVLDLSLVADQWLVSAVAWWPGSWPGSGEVTP